MLFSPAAYLNYRRLANAYKDQTLERYGNNNGTILGLSLALFIVLLVIDILFVITAIYFTFRCTAIKKWPTYLPIIFIILFFIPWIGGIAALAMIIYGLVACRRR